MASVILYPKNLIEGLNDSKKLTEKKREILYPEIIEKVLYYWIIHISPQEVDRINILEVRKLGMVKVIVVLKNVDYAIFDGIFVPPNVFCESY